MTNRGHDRWARAALNAVRKPHTQAAALYRGRVALAERVAVEFSAAGGVANARYGYFRQGFEFVAKRTGGYGRREFERREETYCSTYCMVLCMHLVVGDYTTVAGIKQLLAAANETPDGSRQRDYLRVLRAGELKRPVKCQCCGTAVR